MVPIYITTRTEGSGERYYDSGLREKSWKKYSEEGDLIITIAYRDDVEISINGVRINLPESDTKLIK